MGAKDAKNTGGKMNDTRKWIEEKIGTLGYYETCHAYNRYLLECKTEKPYNAESYARECRRMRQKIDEVKNPEQPFDVKTVVDATDFHEVDLSLYEVVKGSATTWGNENNPNKRVKIDFVPRKNSIDPKQFVDYFLEQVSGHVPTLHTTPFVRESGKLLEILIKDLHLGLLSWAQETGVDYDLKLAKQVFLSSINRAVDWGRSHKVERIQFTFGDDFFNSDTPENTTAHGTRQDEDSRWAKTFTEGWEVVRDGLEICLSVAPTDVIVMPGNHDTTRTYFAAEALRAWFRNNTALTIDNSPRQYKVYTFGSNFIGSTHGHLAKMERLPILFASEFPKEWGDAKNRIIRVGHLHSKMVEEYPGVTIERIRSSGAPSAWSSASGYRSIQAGKAVLWDKDNGPEYEFNIFHK